jgi:hypothetical protein
MYVLSKAVGHADLLLSMVNPVVTVATAVVVFAIGRLLGWRRAWSVVAGATWGLLTVALQSTTELFSEPGVALCESILVLSILMWRRGSRWAPLGLGAALGAVILFRQDSLFTVWVGVLALPLFVPWRAIWRRGALVMISAPIAASLAFTFWYDYLRWHRLLATSYHHEGFHTPLGLGLEGLLVSPGKSFFVFDPIAVLGLLGMAWLLARRDRALGVLMLLLFVPRLVFFAKWDAWEGGLAWGPRFLTPAVFLFVIAAVDLLVATSPRRLSGRAARGAFLVLALASVGVSFLSVRVPYEQWYGALADPAQRTLYEGGRPLLRHPSATNAIIDSQDFTVRASPLIGNYRLIDRGTARVAPALWRRGDDAAGWLVLLAGVALVTVAGIERGGSRRRRAPASSDDETEHEAEDDDAPDHADYDTHSRA